MIIRILTSRGSIDIINPMREYHQYKYQFTHSLTLKLLRSENAPLILSFLYTQFKKTNRIAVPYSEILERLTLYLEDIVSFQEESEYVNTPQGYLDAWCDEEHRYLRKYYEADQDEPIFELTPAAEKALSWFQDLEKKEFIGTESRFFRIFELLKDITQQSNEDPRERVEILKQQRKVIDAKIRDIQKTGMVEVYNSTQVKERFMEARETAHHLLADFREVEQNFKDFAREIQRKRLGEKLTKGNLLQFVLDTDEAIKDSDQGASFYAFYQFLNSPLRQEEMDRCVETLYQLRDIHHFRSKEDAVLKNLKNHLIDAGEKIIASNHRLAEQLRRMLDEKILRENRRAALLLSDIKKMAFRLITDPPRGKNFLMIDGPVRVRLPMERGWWSPPQVPNFAGTAVEASLEDMEGIDLASLFDQFYINIQELRRNIDRALMRGDHVKLVDLLREYPIEKGLAELVGYFSIAAKDGHVINPMVKEEIDIREARGLRRKRVILPQLIFSK